MEFKSSLLLLVLMPIVQLFGQPAEKKKDEAFKVSTVSSYLTSKYHWEKTASANSEKEKENHSPLKTKGQKQSVHSTSNRSYGGASRFTNEDLELNVVQLRTFTVNEFYSPLLRMAEMKGIENLEPESAPGILKDKYFTSFENNILNRWTLPLIGKSQEQLAKERYENEKYNAFLAGMRRLTGLMYQWDPKKARELRRDVYEVHFQNGWSYPDSRIKTP